ncbi:sn-glycerol-3-phosphate-binding periplasmic protein UgpB precursor [Paenibacillus konkukensis]|uniref:Sn-glycerol-3-phosphate-binding periplasmic protein UgpB n=1 Tax=Paenibacillus konkukensis TaxID=2020716 RepID=A0ABY4RMF3_9BACL|nr:ABC transporter substrate-binding protein [Paenibacillus konkukensis]UQZ83051.1 sn-glycerol-3-phosphate-binding periplasmic protein UgpB precursor [Paenibacillus konkukensis]
MNLNKIGCLIIMLALISGCGSASWLPPAVPDGASHDDGADTVELSFYYPVDVGGPLTTTIEEMSEQFMKEHPGIRINPVYMGDYQDTAIKTQAAVQGNNPPDVAVLQSTQLYTMLDMDAIVPLDDYINQAGGDAFVSDFYPAFLADSQADGHTYSIPFQRSTLLMYYNRDAFAEQGLSPDAPPRNWDELLRAAAGLTTSQRWGLEIPSSGGGMATRIFQAFAMQNGSSLMSDDGKQVYLDTAANAEALRYWRDLSHAHKVMPESRIEWASVPDDFIHGKTAMMVYTSGSLTYIRNQAPFRLGVGFLPTNKQLTTPTSGGNFYVFKTVDTRKQDAAWTFVQWMTEPERIAQWSIDTGYIAVRKSAYDIPSLQAYGKEFPESLVARNQLAYSAKELATHNNAKVRAALNEAIEASLSGAMPPEEALKKAQAKADQALASFRRP